jgi:hypothetical protein
MLLLRLKMLLDPLLFLRDKTVNVLFGDPCRRKHSQSTAAYLQRDTAPFR